MAYSLEVRNLVRRLSPCKEAREYVASQASLELAWNNCSNPAWMLWLLTHDKVVHDDSQLRLLACAVVRETPLADGRKVWDLLTDERSRQAVEVAERFARGEATEAELASAWSVASAIAAASGANARSAAAARDAVWYTARSVAWSAAAARDAVAWSAADARSAAAFASARSAAAWVAARDAQCDIIRRFYSWQDVERLLKGE